MAKLTIREKRLVFQKLESILIPTGKGYAYPPGMTDTSLAKHMKKEIPDLKGSHVGYIRNAEFGPLIKLEKPKSTQAYAEWSTDDLNNMRNDIYELQDKIKSILSRLEAHDKDIIYLLGNSQKGSRIKTRK